MADQIKCNKKMLIQRPGIGQEDYWELRMFHRKAKGNKSPRYLIKCGCCEEKVEIYFDEESLEINGVNGSLANWREVLLPLLQGDGISAFSIHETKKPRCAETQRG